MLQRDKLVWMFGVFLTLLFPIYSLVPAYLDFQYGTTQGLLQIYSELHRLSYGQDLGSDFVPYIGSGTVSLLYPVFLALGSDMYAALIAQDVASSWLFIASMFILARLTGLSKEGALFGAALGYVLVYGLPFFGLPPYLNWLESAGSSLLALRSFGPFVVVLVLWLSERHVMHRFDQSNRGLIRAVIWGIVAGLHVHWSNDVSVPGVIALFMALICFGIHKFKPKQIAVQSSVFLLSAGVSFFALLVLLTSGEIQTWWSDYTGVATDQGWFFPTYGEDERTFGYAGLLELLLGYGKDWIGAYRLLLWPALIYLIYAKLKNRSNNFPFIMLLFLTLCAIGSGTLSQIGGHLWERYYAPFFRLGLFVIPWASWVFLSHHGGAIGEWLVSRRAIVSGMTKAVTAVLILVSMHLVLSSKLVAALNELESTSASKVFVSEFGAYVSDEKLPSIEFFRAYRRDADKLAVPPSSRILALSPSGLSPIAGAHIATRHGWFLYALGQPGRQRYIDDFLSQKPDYVLTAVGQPSRWVFRRMGWYFYKHLIADYVPVAKSNYSLVWSKGSNQTEVLPDKLQCQTERVANNQIDLVFHNSPGEFTSPSATYDVNIRYKLTRPDQIVPWPFQRSLLVFTQPDAVLRNMDGSEWTGNREHLQIGLQSDAGAGGFPVDHVFGLVTGVSLTAFPAAEVLLDVLSCEASLIAHLPDIESIPSLEELLADTDHGTRDTANAAFKAIRQ